MAVPFYRDHLHPLRKVIAVILIGAVAVGLGIGAHRIRGVLVAMRALDNTFYDAFYKFRKTEDRSSGQIVLVIVDEESIENLNESSHVSWPWPRDVWRDLLKFLEDSGARAVAFDIIMKDYRGGDAELGAGLDAAGIPVVMANTALPKGAWDTFKPPTEKPVRFGAVNVMEDTPVRRYITQIHGNPSMAAKTLQTIGKSLPGWADDQFGLHYYGKSQRADGKSTYPSVAASALIGAIKDPTKIAAYEFDPKIFKDKIVVIGGNAQSIYDAKSSPIDDHFPGYEVHATAIDNFLNGQYVHPFARSQTLLVMVLSCMLVTAGIIVPRRVTLKILSAFVVTCLLVGFAVACFIGKTIYWLPMASPLLALVLAIIAAFARSYLTEDRQSRFMLKALSQYVSPTVAAGTNPSTLVRGGKRREMTVMFSDIEGFTSMSERMDAEVTTKLLNFYLDEMSGQILDNNGTLDKYAGDSIMCFWNAPVLQPNHAELACRAALAMQHREAEIQGEYDRLRSEGQPLPGAAKLKPLVTRIGINTGLMMFGNMGSHKLFNYSVLGDSVNLGSRLEGANKLYGSRILISENTAKLVEGRFVLRRLDLLQVKGREQPLAVYELMAEGSAVGELRERVERYEEALSAYQSQKWDQADAILAALHERFPDDQPVRALQKRVDKLRKDPPAADWNGVYASAEK